MTRPTTTPVGSATGATRPTHDLQGDALRDLRGIRIIGVVAPLFFVLGWEIIESWVAGEPPLDANTPHLVTLAIATIAAILFGLGMSRLIERTQRRVVRQNRELAAMNAVSTAVQGEVGVPDVVDAALRSVVERTGAVEASITMFPQPGSPRAGEWPTRRYLAPAPSGQEESPDAGSTLRAVEVPLSTGSVVVGRMRISVSDESEPLSSGALQSIGHQLACAIQMGQLVADLEKRRLEASALYEVALQVTSQYALSDILGTIVRYARDLIGADESTVCLSEPLSRAFDHGELGTLGLTYATDGTVCISPDPGRIANRHGTELVCDVRSSHDYRRTLEAPLRGPGTSLGDIWLGRKSDLVFTAADHELLAALGDLAAIAISSARMRETERHGAVLEERDRIAREMHDSLAQVLGVSHLRLRALATRPAVAADAAAESEVTDLADLAEEAYRDVREAILGLRESSHVDRSLIESLHAYLEKYSRQSGIRAALEARLAAEPALAPSAEVQVIRVIQEALTNVRKHSGARSATVRILDDGTATLFVVEDDGHGFERGSPTAPHDGGYGLHTMRERMEQIGGTLTIESALGRGTRVIARVPGHRRLTPELPIEV